MQATQTALQSNDNNNTRKLYIAFELSNRKWKLALSDGERKAEKNIAARDLGELSEAIRRIRDRFHLREEISIVSCYEAGRDGFWLHRYLKSEGIKNVIIDPSSMEVNRRARRSKTDRLDAQALLTRLIRYEAGESKVWSVVRVPEVVQEDERRVHRELERLKKERTMHSNRIRSLLVAQGIELKLGINFVEQLESVRLWDGSELPPRLKSEILREHERFEEVMVQIKDLAVQQREELKRAETKSLEQVQQLMKLKGIGCTSAWVFAKELFGWRLFKNRRELAACAGLTPTPYSSGDGEREQGISKAGNRRIRALIIEISWAWLRFQPHSELSQWYQRRFAYGGKRMRRIGIVALARRLLIELWRYLETGAIPAGAQLKVS